MLSFFSRDVLVEILDLIESVFEGFPTYCPILQIFRFPIFMPNGYFYSKLHKICTFLHKGYQSHISQPSHFHVCYVIRYHRRVV